MRITIRNGPDVYVPPYIYKAQNNNELGLHNYIYYYLPKYLVLLAFI